MFTGGRVVSGRGYHDQVGSSGDPVAPLSQRVSLVLAQPAPHPFALVGVHRPSQALRRDRAVVANRFGLGELAPCAGGGSVGEEQVGLLGAAGRLVEPAKLDRLVSMASARPARIAML
jgi:hypothetical protein